MSQDQIHGSCWCGGITFEVDREAIYFINNCHCVNCRKASGAAFVTMVQVRGSGFRWLGGNDLVRTYESSPGIDRAFCSVCGSLVPQARDFRESVGVPAGELDDRLDRKPQVNIWIGEKADWYTIPEDIPACEERGSPQFWSEVLGGPAERYERLQKELDRRLEE